MEDQQRIREINPCDAKLLDPNEIGYITMKDGTIISMAGANFGQNFQTTTQTNYVPNEYAWGGPKQTTTSYIARTTAPQRVEEGGVVEDRYNYRFYVSGQGYVNGAEQTFPQQDIGCTCECHRNVCECECHQQVQQQLKTTNTRFQSKRAVTPQVSGLGERFVYTEHVKQPERVTRAYRSGDDSSIVRSRPPQVCRGCVHCRNTTTITNNTVLKAPERKTFVSQAQVKKGPEYLDNYRFKEIKGTCPPKKKKK